MKAENLFARHEKFWDGDAQITLVKTPLRWQGEIIMGRAVSIQRPKDFFLGFEPVAGEGWWFESTRGPFARPSRFETPTFNSRSSQEFAARWRKILERGEICRAFGLRDPHRGQHIGISISRAQGCVFWFEDAIYVNKKTPFRWESGAPHLSSEQIWARLQSDLENPDSELTVALRFRAANTRDKMAMLCALPSDEFWARHARLESLLGCVLRLDPDFWLPQSVFHLRLRADYSSPRCYEWQKSACTELESAWIDRLCSAFDFSPDYDAIEKHVAFDEFWREGAISWQIERRPFSMHEKLEAQLQLWEWARENLPPEALAQIEAEF